MFEKKEDKIRVSVIIEEDKTTGERVSTYMSFDSYYDAIQYLTKLETKK